MTTSPRPSVSFAPLPRVSAALPRPAPSPAPRQSVSGAPRSTAAQSLSIVHNATSRLREAGDRRRSSAKIPGPGGPGQPPPLLRRRSSQVIVHERRAARQAASALADLQRKYMENQNRLGEDREEEGEEAEPAIKKFKRKARGVYWLIRFSNMVKEQLEEGLRAQAWFSAQEELMKTVRQSQKIDQAFVKNFTDEYGEPQQLRFNATEYRSKHLGQHRMEEWLADSEIFSPEAREFLEKLPDERTTPEITEIVRCLKQVPTFNAYDHQIQRKLAGAAFYNTYDDGRIVARESAPADGFYFVIRGELLYKKSDNEPRYLAPGSKAGEEDLLSVSQKRTHTLITSLPDTRLLYIHKLDYMEIMQLEEQDCGQAEFEKFFNREVALKEFPIRSLLGVDGSWCTRSYKRGEVICKNNKDSEYLYLLRYGNAQIVRKVTETSSQREKRELKKTAQSRLVHFTSSDSRAGTPEDTAKYNNPVLSNINNLVTSRRYRRSTSSDGRHVTIPPGQCRGGTTSTGLARPRTGVSRADRLNQPRPATVGARARAVPAATETGRSKSAAVQRMTSGVQDLRITEKPARPYTSKTYVRPITVLGPSAPPIRCFTTNNEDFTIWAIVSIMKPGDFFDLRTCLDKSKTPVAQVSLVSDGCQMIQIKKETFCHFLSHRVEHLILTQIDDWKTESAVWAAHDDEVAWSQAIQEEKDKNWVELQHCRKIVQLIPGFE